MERRTNKFPQKNPLGTHLHINLKIWLVQNCIYSKVNSTVLQQGRKHGVEMEGRWAGLLFMLWLHNFQLTYQYPYACVTVIVVF